MRGLGGWLNRDRVYTVTDTNDSSFQETYTVTGPPLLGPDWGAEYAGYRGGMGVPAAWRAARLIAGLFGGLPWHAYREVQGVQKRLEPTPWLLDWPSPPETRVDTFSSLALDYLWHGTAVALLGSRDSTGTPTSMLPVSAERVWGGYVNGRAEYTLDGKVVPRSSLLVVKAAAPPMAVRGLGILEQHFRAIDLSRSQVRASNVANAGVPFGTLQTSDTEASQAELNAARADWLRSQYHRSIAVLPPGVTFQPIAWNPSEAQMIEARKFDLQTWELIFGLPVGFMGGEGPSMRYTNMEQDALHLVKFTLSDILVRFEQALSLLFPGAGPRRTWVRANVDSILRGDTMGRYEAHAVGLTNGFLTLDEVRALENRAPLPKPPPPVPPPTDDDQEDPDAQEGQ